MQSVITKEGYWDPWENIADYCHC